MAYRMKAEYLEHSLDDFVVRMLLNSVSVFDLGETYLAHHLRINEFGFTVSSNILK